MKKRNVMKKFLTLTLACAMTLSLAACGSKTEAPADTSDDQSTAEPADTETKTYKVAIIKQGTLRACGPTADVVGDESLEDVFLDMIDRNA